MAIRTSELENMAVDQKFWSGRRIFITGHTGFKGSWLVLWLQRLGATVSGYALAPPSKPNLFTVACLNKAIHSTTADVCHLKQLQEAMQAANPEIVFHFAAQPLVRLSYAEPISTYATNVMGTVNFLEAIRNTPSVRAAVVVTSDKCYENSNHFHTHIEEDPMGGDNPYASSKACAELVTNAYRRSYFEDGRAAIATARAGNVIGGGDWGKDRLIPDMIKAFSANMVLSIRYPNAIRPWQHVLDPLNGYLLLAEHLWRHGSDYAKGWNFGPTNGPLWRVSEIVDEATRIWGDDAKWEVAGDDQLIEDIHLNIDASMARRQLKWDAHLDMKTALKWSIEWYRTHLDGSKDMQELSLQQIQTYESMR